MRLADAIMLVKAAPCKYWALQAAMLYHTLTLCWQSISKCDLSFAVWIDFMFQTKSQVAPRCQSGSAPSARRPFFFWFTRTFTSILCLKLCVHMLERRDILFLWDKMVSFLDFTVIMKMAWKVTHMEVTIWHLFLFSGGFILLFSLYSIPTILLHACYIYHYWFSLSFIHSVAVVVWEVSARITWGPVVFLDSAMVIPISLLTSIVPIYHSN